MILEDEEGIRISLENDEKCITDQSQDNPTVDLVLGAASENQEEVIDNEKGNEFLSVVKEYASTIPKHGFNVKGIEAKGRTYRHAKKIFLDILNELLELLIPEKLNLNHFFLEADSSTKDVSGPGKVKDAVFDLYLNGAEPVFRVCGTMIVNSYSSTAAINDIQKSITESMNVRINRLKFGKKRCNALRNA